MLDEIIKNQDLGKYLTTYETGQIIFLEGDESQDLYILVSGQLDIFKGNIKINEISEIGTLFGEMSFLLGAKRTATIKARNDVKTIRIPKEDVTTFLDEHPQVAREITKILAQRLDETSQIVYGLKEFCDQLPDAVILTNREGKVITWNSVAEKMYGRDGHQMRYLSAEEIYEETQAYNHFLEEIQSRYSVREKILKIKHPEKGIRYISTSTTVLYDGHHNFQGVLSLGRDVTAVKNLERRYRRARYWIIPSIILIGLLTSAIFLGFPSVSKDSQPKDIKKLELRDQLGKDYILLKSLLTDHFEAGDRSKTHQLMKEFFDIQEPPKTPYIGLVLLDKDKKIFDAYSIKAGNDIAKTLGSSYAGIEFKGSENSLHRILTLYRVDEDHPMGHKGTEIAFELEKDNQLLGWLIFQMNMKLLKRKYEMDEKDLESLRFKKP